MTAVLNTTDVLILVVPFLLLTVMFLLFYLSSRRTNGELKEALAMRDFPSMTEKLYNLRVRETTDPINRKQYLDIPDPRDDCVEFYYYYHYHVAMEHAEKNKMDAATMRIPLAAGLIIIPIVLFLHFWWVVGESDYSVIIIGTVAAVMVGVFIFGTFSVFRGTRRLVRKVDERMAALFREYQESRGEAVDAGGSAGD